MVQRYLAVNRVIYATSICRKVQTRKRQIRRGLYQRHAELKRNHKDHRYFKLMRKNSGQEIPKQTGRRLFAQV